MEVEVLGRKGTGMAEVAGPAIYSTNQPSRDFTSSPTLALHPTLSQPILLHFWAESLASPGSPGCETGNRAVYTRCQPRKRL